jgi:hypothetical protein
MLGLAEEMLGRPVNMALIAEIDARLLEIDRMREARGEPTFKDRLAIAFGLHPRFLPRPI